MCICNIYIYPYIHIRTTGIPSHISFLAGVSGIWASGRLPRRQLWGPSGEQVQEPKHLLGLAKQNSRDDELYITKGPRDGNLVDVGRGANV